MRVFVTGATGFIGSAVTEELMAAGHTVTALARSEETAKKLSSKGIQPILGNLDDMESLRKAAAEADGVIHHAFMHGPSQIPFWKRMGVIFGGLPTGIASRFMKVAAEADQRAIDTFGVALKDSGRPLVTTFGTMGLSHVGFRAAKPATEDDEPDPLSPGIARAKTEEKVEALASLGVRATIIRLAPTVHGDGDTGLIPQLIAIARKKRSFAYVGDGENRWPAVHRRDAARLFQLALEKGVAGGRCFSCHAWHVPTCRTPPGEGGVERCKGGVSPPGARRRASAAKVCTSEARKIGETLVAARGQRP